MVADTIFWCAYMLSAVFAMQALKDMDSNTLKKVLGQVSAASLHATPFRVRVCTQHPC